MEFLQLLHNKYQADMFRLNEKHNGVLNRDKKIYYISESDSKFGFFAMYRCWLEYLYFADVCGFVPVIDAGIECAYRESRPIRGTDNVFEYYFQQPTSINVSQAGHSRHVIVSEIKQREMVELVLTGKRGQYDCNERYKYFMSQVIQKYLKYNTATRRYLDEGLKTLQFGKEKILGVHIRGTDYRKKYHAHPIFITEEDCFVVIENILEKKNYAKIFVATDDETILHSFVKRYGKKICFYEDVMRSNDKKSIIFHRNVRAHHKFKSGLEVIRDMYTLSGCDGLVAGVSQVAICAQINKMARREKYKDCVVIDKGIYRNGHYFKV